MKRQHLVDGTLAIIALVCALAAVRGIMIGVPADDLWLFPTVVVLPALVALTLALCLRAQPSTRTNVALLTLSLGFGLFVVEGVLQALLPAFPPSREQAALDRGLSWDLRDKAEVALDLRAEGTDASLLLPARTLRTAADRGGVGAMIDGHAVVPLANSANRVVVNCNESGRYTVFRTDERGFNNPAGTWSRPIDVVVIGDSFVVGSCVDAADNAVARIRERGIRVAGAGTIEFGPLSELGVLKEYVAPVKPRDVFWFYYEWNDLHDLQAELRVPELVAYLEPGHTQDLIASQSAIGAQIDAFVEARLAERAGETPTPRSTGASERRPAARVLDEWVKLYRLRRAVGLTGVSERVSECCDLESLREVMEEAKRTVDTWGGRLHLVYLPAGIRYYGPASALTNDAMRQRRRVIRIAEEAGLSVVDVDAAFREQGDGRAMFFDYRSHYSVEGYRVTADAVVRALEEVGYTTQ